MPWNSGSFQVLWELPLPLQNPLPLRLPLGAAQTCLLQAPNKPELALSSTEDAVLGGLLAPHPTLGGS